MLRLIIENFKSIERLDLELGRVNLFIGENGCGKSTLLEALSMAAAAVTGTLSNASLKARGLRVTDPVWMRSAFSPRTKEGAVRLGLLGLSGGFVAQLEHGNSPYGHWISRVFAKLSEALPLEDEANQEAAQAALDFLNGLDSITREFVAHLDTDRCDEPYFGVSRRHSDGQELWVEELCAQTIARLVREIEPAVYQQFQSRILFAVAVESTECWLLPLYYSDNHRKKTVNCLRTLNEALKGQDGFSIAVSNKQVKYYRKIVKRIGKRKDVEAHASPTCPSGHRTGEPPAISRASASSRPSGAPRGTSRARSSGLRGPAPATSARRGR